MGIKRAGPCIWCANCIYKSNGYCQIFKCVIVRPVSKSRCSGYEQDPKYQALLQGKSQLKREDDPDLKELFDDGIL